MSEDLIVYYYISSDTHKKFTTSTDLINAPDQSLLIRRRDDSWNGEWLDARKTAEYLGITDSEIRYAWMKDAFADKTNFIRPKQAYNGTWKPIVTALKMHKLGDYIVYPQAKVEKCSCNKDLSFVARFGHKKGCKLEYEYE